MGADLTKEEKRAAEYADFAAAMEDMSRQTALMDRMKVGLDTVNLTEYDVNRANQIITRGSLADMRALSNYFYNLSGIYKRVVLFFATALTFDYLVVPKIVDFNGVNDEKMQKAYMEAINFVDSLEIKNNFPRIVFSMVLNGIYYGILREGEDGKIIIQDLPYEYCRSTYKTLNNLYAIEFDMKYFDSFRNINERIEALEQFPLSIVQAYEAYLKDKNLRWVPIDEELAVCFPTMDARPVFLSMIPDLMDLRDYKNINKIKDKAEISKLIIQKLPKDKDNNPVFSAPEMKAFHKLLVNLVKNSGMPDIDVFTTFGELEMLHFTEKNTVDRDNLAKAERSVYSEAGISKNLFATDSSASLEASIKTDESLLFSYLPMFETFLNYQVSLGTKKDKNYFFEVMIPPITHYNRKEMVELYKGAATLGYPKMLLGAAMGLSQRSLMGLSYYENKILNITEMLVPLQSSHTISGESKGGRPELAGTEKSEKTVKNEESADNS
jgi:hypothetical protein